MVGLCLLTNNMLFKHEIEYLKGPAMKRVKNEKPDIKKATKPKYSNKDLPSGCHADDLWCRVLIPTLAEWFGRQSNPFDVPEAETLAALQTIWDKVLGECIPHCIEIGDAIWDVVCYFILTDDSKLTDNMPCKKQHLLPSMPTLTVLTSSKQTSRLVRLQPLLHWRMRHSCTSTLRTQKTGLSVSLRLPCYLFTNQLTRNYADNGRPYEIRSSASSMHLRIHQRLDNLSKLTCSVWSVWNQGFQINK
jgi:hypothetical protein